MKRIFVDYSRFVTTIFILENDVLDNLFSASSNPDFNIGNIYCAKVLSVCEGLDCAFLDIDGKKVFMEHKADTFDFGPMRKDMRAPLKEGGLVLVRLTKEAVRQKGDRVAPDITLAGRTLVLTDSKREVAFSGKLERDKHICEVARRLGENKDENVGFILRTQAKGYSAEYILREAEALTKKYFELIRNFACRTSTGLLYAEDDLVAVKFRDIICKEDDIAEVLVNSERHYDYLNALCEEELPNLKGKVFLYEGIRTMYTRFNLSEQIKSITSDRVALKNGGNLIIEKTQSLITVDVNSAHCLHDDAEKTAFETNKAAAEELARQIRLRDLGGIIIADFIDMKEKQHITELIELLKKHTSRDYSAVKVKGLTRLGLCEITRERVRNNYENIAYQDCPYCDGRGEIQSDLLTAYFIKCGICELAYKTQAKEIGVYLHQRVLDFITGRDFFSEYFESCLKGIKIYLLPQADARQDYFRFDLVLGAEDKKNAVCCCART
jgi:ribonuclease G